MADPTRPAVLAGGLVYPESPRWDRGSLLVSDVHAFRLVRVRPDGTWRTVREVPGRPAGLGRLPDGRLLLATALDRTLLAGPEDGPMSVHADLSGLTTGLLNDMIVDPGGGAWVGDTGHALGAPERPGRLLRVEADGTARVACEDLVFPNGLALTPDGRTLYVAETFARRITRFDVAPDGALSGRAVHAVLDGIPDGLCLDGLGRLWVALPELFRCDTVTPAGDVETAFGTGDWRPIAVCSGGPGRRTLFCTLARLPEDGTRSGRVAALPLEPGGAGTP
ncbi:sugar lactone lactonase YvrE [Thermocatellispora tengchongensis]|uniref:Sugar lactone lactonase YvrE n=2 Tax=Thermocatellispora tengchongensis TaxID=1073253 RepID=A0A840PGC4_9ACTN|nr:SMP-30/gluconolactonase/LRE family protein [Thermocatellispora tengchongensis]MBB5137856.1 sugar lactone lactonase YvrE [Thermocatellispora tengchongensis]